jgi:hypothetical protein
LGAADVGWRCFDFRAPSMSAARRGELTDDETSEMRRIISLALAGAIMVVGLALLDRPVRADGLPPPPQAYPPPQPSQSCLMTALQLGYQTGRREVAYANTEACLLFTRSRGAVLPYGYYGPYVPSGWVPPGWVLPPPGYGLPGPPPPPGYGPPP